MRFAALVTGLVFSIAAAAAPVVGQFTLKGVTYKVEKLTEGHGVIWGMDFVAADQLLFTEKAGRLLLLDLRSGLAQTVKNPPEVYAAGQGGLLDLALAPDFTKSKWVYVSYAKRVGSKNTTALARAQLDLPKRSFGPWEELFVARPAFETAHHYGSRIAFDEQGHLFLSVGDRGQDQLAQSLESHSGKILRLTLEGRAAAGNPFEQDPKALKEIWSYGHRNPQGLFFDKASQKLYEHEHGPMGGDEINLIEGGKNYGWPVITYGREYSGAPVGRGETARPGMEQPLHYYVPSIAPSGLLLYRSKALPAFTDRFVSGALALQHLNVRSLSPCRSDCEERLVKNLQERVRDVAADEAGAVYFSTDSGRIYRITK